MRTICPFCKKSYKADIKTLEASGIDLQRFSSHTFFRGEGCIQCAGTGYKGRQAISELLDLTDEIREMLVERRSSADIKRAARQSGMKTLRESSVEKAFSGQTTLEEINRVTFVES